MRTSIVLVALIGLVGVVSGCNDGALGSGACDDLHDAASCDANPLCHSLGCSPCGGERSFGGCFPIGENPPIACPALACAPCSGFNDRASCEANTQCEASICMVCGGEAFLGCYEKGTAPEPVCPASCPACVTDDEATCTTNSACHAVYKDLQACGCAPAGCCTTFDHCALGPAVCTLDPGEPTCNSPDPVCEGDYVVGYSNNCPEGCVKQTQCSDCRTTGCAMGETCQICFAGYSCIPDGAVC